MKVFYGKEPVGDVDVFYREGGRPDAPVILLLHGFPTSGHMFRNLIPALTDRYRVIAPDLPGFGNTVAPPRAGFEYSFDSLAEVIGSFVDALGLSRYALYIFDYGAPTGLRLAMKHPERVAAIVTQNGNAYVEGLSKEWEPWQAYWRSPTAENRERCRASLSDDAIRFQYLHGSPAELVAPDGYKLDQFYMARPEARDIQLDLVLSYRTNVALYPRFQQYFREHRPPLLAIWGKNDPFFIPPGAEAYKRDLPDAEVHFLDTGHFALETHCDEIAARMRDLLARHLKMDDRPQVVLERPNKPTYLTFQRRSQSRFEKRPDVPAVSPTSARKSLAEENFEAYGEKKWIRRWRDISRKPSLPTSRLNSTKAAR